MSNDSGAQDPVTPGGGDCDPRFSPAHPVRPAGVASGGSAADPSTAGSGSGTSTDTGTGATATARHRRRLILVLAITLGVVGVQLVGALVSGSLALLADAGHMISDATGVAIALVASLIAGRPATSKRTYGYLRVEVLAALANGIVLGVIAVVILVEAIGRFGAEIEIATGPMLIAAVIGAAANLASLLILRSGQRESLNVRGAYLEVLGDLLGSGAVILAGLIIMFTGLDWVDQIASIVIALMIAPRAFKLLREVVDVLLEASPRGFDIDAVREHMLSVPGVAEVHDVHAWLLTSGVPAFSAHITVAEESPAADYHAVLDELKACLREHFDVDHTTLQLEPRGHRRPGPHRHD